MVVRQTDKQTDKPVHDWEISYQGIDVFKLSGNKIHDYQTRSKTGDYQNHKIYN